ncbi:hypothetical protein GCM10011428_40470 [Streptomyces violaceus]
MGPRRGPTDQINVDMAKIRFTPALSWCAAGTQRELSSSGLIPVGTLMEAREPVLQDLVMQVFHHRPGDGVAGGEGQQGVECAVEDVRVHAVLLRMHRLSHSRA